MKTIKTLTAIALTAVLAFLISGCSSGGGDDPVLPLPPAHVHAYSDSWTSNETHHWHAATCEHDVKKDEASHEWDHEDFQYDAASGNEIRTCSVCGYVNSKTHVHTWDHEDFQLDAASGKEIKTCTVCGFVVDKNHAHTEDSGTVTTASTCSEKGLRTYKCTVCDKVLRTEEIAVTDHTEDSGTVTTAPTCVTKGIKTYMCTVCDKVLRTEEIPATNHTEDSGTVTTAPTCIKKGVRTYMCTVCNGVARTEEIPATDHTEDSGTVTKNVTLDTDGERTYKCTVCGNKRTEPITKPELYETPIDAETGLAATKSSKYIYFGMFPKTVTTENITVDENVFVTMGANTYYKGKNDENYYVKVKENAYGTGTEYKYSDGTQAKQSSSNSYRYFKVEPVKWKVITDRYRYSYSEKCLLLAEDILTANVPYYGADSSRMIAGNIVSDNNYKYSTIRAYLNGKYESNDTQSKTAYENKGFLQTAFTAEAQNLIAVTTVDNSAVSTTDPGWHLEKATNDLCENTNDKIFLLSENEATNYSFPAYDKYGEGNARIRKTTDYAKANYAMQSSTAGYGGVWWLRSPHPSNYSSSVRYVNYDGGANYYSCSVNRTDRGVVPALSISLP